jgi:hypothetical protein
MNDEFIGVVTKREENYFTVKFEVKGVESEISTN